MAANIYITTPISDVINQHRAASCSTSAYIVIPATGILASAVPTSASAAGRIIGICFCNTKPAAYDAMISSHTSTIRSHGASANVCANKIIPDTSSKTATYSAILIVTCDDGCGGGALPYGGGTTEPTEGGGCTGAGTAYSFAGAGLFRNGAAESNSSTGVLLPLSSAAANVSAGSGVTGNTATLGISGECAAPCSAARTPSQ